MTRAPGLKLVAAAVGAAAVLALAGSAMGTSARWSDSADFGATTVQTGQLTLRTGNATTQVANYQFTELAGNALGPGSWAQAPLTVKNAGSANLVYRLAGVTASNTALGAALLLTVQRVAAATDCPSGVGVAAASGPLGLYSGTLTGGTTTARPLAIGASEALCIRVTIDPSAGAGLQSASSTATFTFTATQS